MKAQRVLLSSDRPNRQHRRARERTANQQSFARFGGSWLLQVDVEPTFALLPLVASSAVPVGPGAHWGAGSNCAKLYFSVIAFFGDIGTYCGPAFGNHPSGEIIAVSITVHYILVGFIQGFLLAYLWLPGAFARASRNAAAISKENASE
jgi:hypothetical protein